MSNNNIAISSGIEQFNLPKGASLALLDSDGNILQQGKELANQLFSALTEEVVAQIFTNPKPISPKTFQS